MKRSRLFGLALAALAATAMVGCDTAGNAPPTPAEPTRTPDTTSKAPPARTETPARSPGTPVPPGMNVLTTYLPTGERAGSALMVTKSTPKEVLVGQEFDYKIKLTNLTRTPVKGVVLTANLPRDFQVTGTGPQATVSGRTAVWNVGDLAGGASKPFLVRGKATKVASLVCCSEVTFKNPAFCLVVKAVQPALKIVKTAPAEVILCDVITSKIVVTNTGTGAATNVRVTDVLPDGMKTVDGKSRLAYDLGTLPAGQSREITLRTKAAKTGSYANKASVAADGGLAATSTEAKTVVRQPVLTLTKTGPADRYVGRKGTYVLTVTNTGDAPARSTVVTDTVPAGAEVVGVTEGGKLAGGKVTWALGTLAPKDSRKLTIVLKPTQRGRMVNLASAKAYCAEATARIVTNVKGISAILLECVDLQDPIEVGAQTTYVITVTNQGTAEGTNISVKCTLPAQQAFVSAAGASKETVTGKQVVFAPVRSLAPKAKAVFRVVVKGAAVGDVRFKVSLTSDQMTSPAEETESTHIYE